jgi:peptidyl-tRNA hydrolase, PTH1 family
VRPSRPPRVARRSLAEDRWLIIGLGNPGSQYAGNRHNIGFMACDRIAARIGAKFKRDRSRAEVLTGTVGGTPVTVAKPMTFMNLSGQPVAALGRFYKVPPERLVVLHDELDIPFGSIRLKLGGGDNGHNGLRSITSAIGKDYHRVRFGIGRPPGRMDAADYVLHDFTAAERKELPEIIERGTDAVALLVARGLAAAQNEFH